MIRGRALRVWIALAIVLGVALGQVPLFGVLGYELALAVAVFAAIAGVHLGAATAREVQRSEHAQTVPPGRALARTALAASGIAAAVTLVPGIICAVRGLWTPTCDWWFGLVAYAGMPLATALLAGAFGHAIGVAVGVRPRERDRWWKPHRGSVLALLPLVGLALLSLWRFYGAPPVFTYNAIIGYFPGNLYDENVHLGMPLVWARLEQLLSLIAILGALATRLDVPTYRVVLREPQPIGLRVRPVIVALACAIGATVLHVFGGALGYAVDTSDIEAVLDGRIETPHFIIHYAHTKEIDRDIALIARDHELRYAEVVAELGAAPAGKLESFYFADRDQKGRWMGARDVEMAKPWRHEIYLDHRSFPHTSLRHEIAHAVASAFGDPLFGVAARRVLGVPVFISPGLVEGLAVAADWPAGDGRLTPHESVRALEVMGLTPTIQELLSLRFLTVSSARSYTTAGSFMRYLLDTYGAPKLRALYHSGGDFAGAYGKPLAQLEDEWRAMIEKIQLPPDVVEGTRERFRAGSVFARPCPHAIAARREKAMRAYVEGDRAKAVALMRHVCSDAPEEPLHRLALGDFLVSGPPDERAEAQATWQALADGDDSVTSSVRADALERLARLASAHGDLATTKQLIARAHALPVDPAQMRQLDAESRALAHEGPAGPALRGYFFSGAAFLDGVQWAQLAVLAEPKLALAHYLLGLQKLNENEWADAAAELDRALQLGLPDLLFVKNAARKLAIAAYRIGDTVGVSDAITVLYGPGMATTDHLLADDWARRLQFDATGRL